MGGLNLGSLAYAIGNLGDAGEKEELNCRYTLYGGGGQSRGSLVVRTSRRYHAAALGTTLGLGGS